MKETKIYIAVFLCFVFLAVAFSSTAVSAAKGETLKIGVIGVLSGEAAGWGLPMKHATMVLTKQINDKGGLLIDGKRYPIKLYVEDDRFDAKVTRSAAEKLIYREKIKYFVGPNASIECSAFQAVGQPAKVINIGYGYGTKRLWSPKHPYGILGMRAGYETSPFTYEYLMKKYGIKTISFLTKNYDAGLRVQKGARESAAAMGLKVLVPDATYEIGTVDFFPVLSRLIKDTPDVLDISPASSHDAGLIAKGARQLGFKGKICTSSNNDAVVIDQVAGEHAEGMLWIGNIAPGADLATPALEKFGQDYKKLVGEWNDSASDYMYALNMLTVTLQKAGAKALTDTSVFLEAMPKVAWPNPYVKGNPILRYIGKELFGHNHQIGIPMVLLEMKNKKAVPVRVE